MPDDNRASVGMDDMIGATRQRLKAKPDSATRLQNLVAEIPKQARA
jgi:hypothetical protein